MLTAEPTTGLDSRAAQIVVRCLKRVAQSGRSIVCTIHQPSTYIFSTFDSLLLLQRGGQTVFFGELGRDCEYLIEHFSSAPGVDPFPGGRNPATWMLQVIGAGTARATDVLQVSVDFAAYYKSTSLCQANGAKVLSLTKDHTEDDDIKRSISRLESFKHAVETVVHSSYASARWTQFKCLFSRTFISYWRTPSYNFLRMVISILIALIFASVYANQKYDTDAKCIARTGVVFLTLLFCGIVGMNTVIPVMMANRASFYREQQERLYDPIYYEISLNIVEVRMN